MHFSFLNTPSEIISEIEKINASQIFVLCDENTYIHCFLPYFENCSFQTIVIASGESSKSIETFEMICNHLSVNYADKNTLLVNLGGGMVCDIGGFVASVYKRGIRFINIPTTLLAMADAAYGGKTALNLGSVKNIIGSFYPAEKIILSDFFLNTLAPKEYHSGFAEICKSMLLFAPEEWKQFSQNPSYPAVYQVKPFVKLALHCKQNIVEKDPFEKNERLSLNYGHSIGHAIEAVYNTKDFPLLHGEAIFWGMALENLLAFKLGLLQEDTMQSINQVLQTLYPLPTELVYIPEILEALKNDKKNDNDTIQMVLLSDIGKYLLKVPVALGLIQETLQNYARPKQSN